MKTSIFIGTSGWTYPEWTDAFYPVDLPKDRWLEYYSSQFKIVELNATFYRNFPESVYNKWYNTTPKNFHFVIKVSRYITHQKLLIDIKKSVELFENNVSLLKEKLGLLLLQLPPRMPYFPERLYD